MFSYLDAFCDENGIENSDKPRSLWTVKFTRHNDKTMVNITLKQETPEDVETMIKMGFKEGLTMALENLDEVLRS